MAATVPSTEDLCGLEPARFRANLNPIALWHLLSLDAPTVAALWTWFFAACNHVHLPVSSFLAMAIAVWMVYVADRLLDARSIDALAPYIPEEMEERHMFHQVHRRAFLAGFGVAAVSLALLIRHLPSSSLRLYCILGGLLATYFALIHLSGRIFRLPKELAVGFFFAAALLIPTISRQPQLKTVLLPAAVLFGALCSLNCLFIYAWEHPDGPGLAHAATRFALRFLTPITAMLVAFSLAFVSAHDLPWQIPAACAASASLLVLLHSVRKRFAPPTLRASADLCLLTPLLLLFSLR